MSKEQVALVTGASRGIGRGIALDLARTHTVVATYRGRRDAAGSLQAECGADIVQSDIGSAADREALIGHVRQKYGRLDLLVNNAGIAPRERKDILEATEEIFDEVLDTNLKGPYFLTQLAARLMAEKGSGRIVFITSISAYTASTMRGEYCISKAGLAMAVSLWAARLAAHGIGVFEIRPGIIRTDMIEKVRESYEEKAKSGLLPQGRLGDPADVARAVRAVADGLLDYGTGTVINADGGFHLRTL
jgi:NAD(P)-dependent dehydrogenase (short-subunit alcohol dehydrogenase family)